MAQGDIKVEYDPSAAVTQTNLDGLASSATHIAGWKSPIIDNSSSKFDNFAVNAVLKVAAAGLSAGEIHMYIVAELNDSSFPDVFGTGEGTATVSDTNVRDAICRLAAQCSTDTTAGQLHYVQCPSVRAIFGDSVPRKFQVFVTQSTGAALETTGDPNQVYVRGEYATVAP